MKSLLVFCFHEWHHHFLSNTSQIWHLPLPWLIGHPSLAWFALCDLLNMSLHHPPLAQASIAHFWTAQLQLLEPLPFQSALHPQPEKASELHFENTLRLKPLHTSRIKTKVLSWSIDCPACPWMLPSHLYHSPLPLCLQCSKLCSTQVPFSSGSCPDYLFQAQGRVPFYVLLQRCVLFLLRMSGHVITLFGCVDGCSRLQACESRGS